MFSSPPFKRTDLYFFAHRFNNVCNFISRDVAVCPPMSLHSTKTAMHIKNNPFHLHALPHLDLIKIPGRVSSLSFIYSMCFSARGM
jgi:hypothetical protein